MANIDWASFVMGVLAAVALYAVIGALNAGD